VPAETGGEVRATFVGRYLCVAARLPEPTGSVVARSIGRNPHWEEEDLLQIVVGAYPDWSLQVGPFGAYSLETKGSVIPTERFVAAARIGDKEWRVEAAIPVNTLRAARLDEIRVSIVRIRAMRPGSPEQRWRWPEYEPAAKVPPSPAHTWDAPAPLFRPAPVGNIEPPLQAGGVKELPPLTAGWNDPAWDDVPAWDLLRNEPAARLPRIPTQVRLLHDRSTLAVIARCTEPDAIVARAAEHDGAVDRDDSFQIYLATSGSSYVQLAINPRGFVLDSAGKAGGPRVARPRPKWHSQARKAVWQEQGAWTIRLDIPLQQVATVLGEERMPPEWRVLLLRFRPGRPDEALETSVLPVVETDTPLCPARYRRLLLSDSDPAQLRSQTPERGGALAPFETRVLSTEQRKELRLAGMLDRNLQDRIDRFVEADKREWEQVKTLADWERFRDPRLKALRASLGEFPARIPLQTRVIKDVPEQGYHRQDLVYQSRPGLWVTANLYLPSKPLNRMPGIVIIHSHHRPRTQAELQDMGILWARAGCAVLIMDQAGHGERIQAYPWNRDAYHARATTVLQLYLVGESLVKWIVWDVMRGIDLLLERKDIDPDRIILLGAVAGGGDPAAVAAALDSRIAAVAPFNFGRRGKDWGAGWGEWESTRCLRRSIVEGFLPWVICASVAPRRLVYSNEMGWNGYQTDRAWLDYQQIFRLYNAPDNLDEAHGFGSFPGPGECTNIGPAQRGTLYPELQRWFGIPIPTEEPDDRRPEAELAALNPSVASQLRMRTISEVAHATALAKLRAVRAELRQFAPQARREWLRARWAARLGDIEPNRRPEATPHWKKRWADAEVEGITLKVEPGILVPLLLLRPAAAAQAGLPVVVAVSQGGKERILAERSSEIEALLKGGAAVCLPDLRGTGETLPDQRRGLMSEERSAAATELMLGNTLLGARLKDLRTVLAYLSLRQELDPKRAALWGDSFVPVNPPRLLLEETRWWQVGPDIQHQGEPLGGLLALLGALYEDNVRAAAARQGLVGYLSILESPFANVPYDIVVPGVFDAGDVGDLAAGLAPRPLLLEAQVDGRNRLVPQTALSTRLASVYDAYRTRRDHLLIRSRQGTPTAARWLLAHL
jgi:hypothetical protein